jgi:RNA polymerase sigma-70 factor, ECF subfamily
LLENNFPCFSTPTALKEVFTLTSMQAENGANQDASRDEITLLLQRVQQGDSDAVSRLVPMVYAELRRTARHYLDRERPDHTLQPTALANDALLELLGGSVDWKNRAHFFGVAAIAMRRMLLDHARRCHAEKRGGDVAHVPLGDVQVGSVARWDELLAVDRALDRLEEQDARLARIVELRFYAGMTDEEVAEVMQLSPRTIRRDWQIARAWLHREMTRSAIAPQGRSSLAQHGSAG